jgi:hypothetical protein
MWPRCRPQKVLKLNSQFRLDTRSWPIPFFSTFMYTMYSVRGISTKINISALDRFTLQTCIARHFIMVHGHLRNDYIGTVWLIRICIEFPRIGNFLADPKLLFYPRSGSRIIIPDPEPLHSGSGYRTVIQDPEPELLITQDPDTEL